MLPRHVSSLSTVQLELKKTATPFSMTEMGISQGTFSKFFQNIHHLLSHLMTICYHVTEAGFFLRVCVHLQYVVRAENPPFYTVFA